MKLLENKKSPDRLAGGTGRVGLTRNTLVFALLSIRFAAWLVKHFNKGGDNGRFPKQ